MDAGNNDQLRTDSALASKALLAPAQYPACTYIISLCNLFDKGDDFGACGRIEATGGFVQEK